MNRRVSPYSVTTSTAWSSSPASWGDNPATGYSPVLLGGCDEQLFQDSHLVVGLKTASHSPSTFVTSGGGES